MTVREGKDIALLAFGPTLSPASDLAEQLNATVVNMRFVKPLDEDMIRKIAASHKTIFTLEENVVKGGAGSAVNEFINQAALSVNIYNIGLPDRNLEHGSREELLEEAGLDVSNIKRTIQAYLKTNP